ncbi:(d)CMP kinase [Labrys sp. LIt4]|uniref:Cytidylate kinase n=1 Tax=Labrys okinawensis TaxID=346911 RepID=A0A2S9QG92_9HYPH|nr:MULTISPECIES: (d)CMP kinase [Labrys]MBP0579815.1 (d)CMP kinase [Labrys sp. LIt4]PRH88368.1 (d)CMP kinase [Labrys okinawensis]
MIIAIDGPAASGKGTLAKRLAAHLGLPHLDTGLLYRAVGRAAIDGGIDLEDADATAEIADGLDVASLDESRLRGREMGEAASVVASHPKVRKALLDLQRRFAHQRGGAVLDGRDIGTVIAPGAEVKIFVTADAEIRARRRHLELEKRGDAPPFASVLADIRKRDARDAGRADAPLKPAPDAHVLDTTALDVESAFAAALAFVERHRH